MNNGTEIILQQFWGLDDIHSVTVDEIEARCAEYPYFAPLQLLLAQKYKKQQHESFIPQASKTAVYFNNWHWLAELLEGRVSFTATPWDSAQSTPAAADELPAKIITVATETSNFSLPEDPAIQETVADTFAATGVHDIIEENKEDSLVIITEPEAAEETGLQVEEGPIATVETGDNKVGDITSVELNEDPVEPETFIEPESAVINAELHEVQQMNNREGSDEFTAEMIETGDDSDEPAVYVSTEHGHGALPGIEEMKENISLLKNVLTDLNTGTGPVIPIEPLHTIDYFASQGIKLKDLGIDPHDNLGNRLKSFTEWLKTMKRLHPEKLEASMDEKSQSSIQHMAEHSNTTTDVLTEAIAEVYARQGLKEKAREVYLKLSLQNPGKSAYFAAKISNLNEL